MSKIAKSMAVLGVVAGLGVAALPLSSYAAEDSGPVTIQATVNSQVGVVAAKNLVNLGTVTAGAQPATGNVDVTVTTSLTNYTLSIIDADANNALTRTATSTGDTTGKTTSIQAGVPAAGTVGWGFKVTGSQDSYKAVPVSTGTAETINSGAVTGGSATTNVTFGVSVDNTIADGVYEDDVVFRATASNS